MRGGVNALILLATLSSAGCFRPARALVEPASGEWLARHGNLQHAPFLDETVPAAVQQRYSQSLGRGLPALPVLHGDLMLAVISGGGVVVASAQTGERYWSRRFDGSVAGQLLRVGDRIVFATQQRRGEVHALDMRRGRRAWRRKLDVRPAAEPAYADGTLYLAGEHGSIMALDAGTGAERWRTEIGGVVLHAPAVIGDELVVVSRDTLHRIVRATGVRSALHPVLGATSAPLAVAGDTVIIATQADGVAAYAERGAREVWRHRTWTGDTAAPVLAAPVVTPDGVYVLNRAGEVWRITRGDAARIAALDGAATESLTVARNGILIGLLDGTLHFLTRDGQPVWTEALGSSLRAPAAVHDGAVFAATINGRMVKLEE